MLTKSSLLFLCAIAATLIVGCFRVVVIPCDVGPCSVTYTSLRAEHAPRRVINLTHEEFRALPTNTVPVIRVVGYRGGMPYAAEVVAVRAAGYVPAGQLEMPASTLGCREDDFVYFRWKAYALGFDAVLASDVACSATALVRASE